MVFDERADVPVNHVGAHSMFIAHSLKNVNLEHNVHLKHKDNVLELDFLGFWP